MATSNTAVTNSTSSATSQSDITALKGKKILQFPLNLGTSMRDERGNDIQYMLIRIISDEKGSTLRNDSATGAAYGFREATTGTGDATFKTIKASDDTGIQEIHGSGSGATTDMVAKKGKVRLDKVIVLPMPNNYDVNSSISYNPNYDPGLLTKAADVIQQIGDGVAGELTTLVKNKGIAAIVNSIKGGATSTNALLAEEGYAWNPKKEVMFDNFSFRQFGFRYTFAPKSKEEADMVSEIIETLRYYALPEISPAKFFYILPAEFQIEFMLGNKINPNIPRITTSFLQRVSVNYAPSGVWSSLPNGSPVALDLSLEFLENELIDRNRVYSAEKDASNNATGRQSIISGY